MSGVDVTTDDGGPFDLGDVNGLRLDEILPHPAGCAHEPRFTAATIRVTCAHPVADWDPDPGADGRGRTRARVGARAEVSCRRGITP
ncbi:hypothetical protein [Actinacidiphila glaucinigra]|uniref:hypothetical protein n=1 Tax=Actinacidiphila glaucinigra TaxID=235986 RepID=UPI003D8D0791